MADYFPLLARALDTMSDRSPETRRVVYARAKAALTSQLRSLDPPLGEAEIGRETQALDEAIARAEQVYGSETAPPPQPVFDPPATETVPEAGQRPRVEPQQPAIRRGGGRNRSRTVVIGLGAIMVPAAIVAWLWRDHPTPVVQEVARVQPAAPAAPTDSKFADRIGGEAARPVQAPAPAPPASPTASSQPPSSTPAPAQAPVPTQPPAQPELAVAQRALLVEENTADPQQPKVTAGRALWRIDALNAGQGQALETVVRATLDVAEAGLSLTMLIRRNTDAAFPASHTIELTFTAAGGGQNRVVRDVAMPQLKTDETMRGVALAGLSVPVKENIFLVGLSDLRGDIDRNTDLLLRRNWIDLPIRFVSGQRAVLSFEKGVSGDRVLAEAFRQWGGAQ